MNSSAYNEIVTLQQRLEAVKESMQKTLKENKLSESENYDINGAIGCVKGAVSRLRYAMEGRV